MLSRSPEHRTAKKVWYCLILVYEHFALKVDLSFPFLINTFIIFVLFKSYWQKVLIETKDFNVEQDWYLHSWTKIVGTLVLYYALFRYSTPLPPTPPFNSAVQVGLLACCERNEQNTFSNYNIDFGERGVWTVAASRGRGAQEGHLPPPRRRICPQLEERMAKIGHFRQIFGFLPPQKRIQICPLNAPQKTNKQTNKQKQKQNKNKNKTKQKQKTKTKTKKKNKHLVPPPSVKCHSFYGQDHSSL